MEEIIFNVQTVYVHNSSYNSKKKIKGSVYMWYIQRWKLLWKIVPCCKRKVFLLNDLFFNTKVSHGLNALKPNWRSCWMEWLVLHVIYASLSWFIFAPLVLMAFELHSQIFPTLILSPITTLEKSLWFVLCMWSQWWRMRRYASLW